MFCANTAMDVISLGCSQSFFYATEVTPSAAPDSIKTPKSRRYPQHFIQSVYVEHRFDANRATSKPTRLVFKMVFWHSMMNVE